VVQKFGGLTARDAQVKLDAKKRKEDEAEAKRQKMQDNLRGNGRRRSKS
jgi:hypothetical protein